MNKISFRPKALSEQVIVIIGAAGEAGLRVAKLALDSGARVVLTVPHKADLKKFGKDILAKSGQALSLVADPSKLEDLEHVKEMCLGAFGQMDTWVNFTSVRYSSYLTEIKPEDERKVFEMNFWSARNGSQVAVEYMRLHGGTLINLGQEVMVDVMPLQGLYAASKNALKIFTDTLRNEIREQGFPIEVSLLRPTLDQDELVAEAILKCAVKPQRGVYVGGPARLTAILDTFFPRVKDIMSETRLKEMTKDKTA